MEEFIEEKNVAVEIKEKPENRIRNSLDFMRACLAQDKVPAFRDFWEAKQLCLELFKENIPSHTRGVFWQEYVDLMKQARTLKEILDEKSAFSEEQIRLAIQAIVDDLDQLNERVHSVDKKLFPENSTIFKGREESYLTLQHELDLLNLIAKRIKSLRDELIEINIRIRTKNQFFAKLSEIGDRVFPRRKELIESISSFFQQDVEQFISKCGDFDATACFGLKEEIKILQNIAKEISLNTNVFSVTREMLSAFWNQIRQKEQQFKVEKAEKREVYQKNMQSINPKIDAFMKSFEDKVVSEKEIDHKLDALFEESKALELGKEEIKFLKMRLSDCKKSLIEQIKQKKQQKQAEEREENQHREHKLRLLHEEIQSHIDRAEGLSLDVLVEKWEFFLKQIQGLVREGIEQLFFQNLLAMLKDLVQEKKLVLWMGEKNADLKPNVEQLLEDRVEERKKVKMSLEAHRRIVGGSSLNLEMAMQYQKLIEDERMRLDSLEMLIEEIEQKLFDLGE